MSETAQAEPGGGVLPDSYRPAASDDVMEGRACGNCSYFEAAEDSMGMCALWAAVCQADYYCDGWEAAVEETTEEVEMSAVPRASFETVDAADLPDVAGLGGGRAWEGILTIEQEMTGDGRMFEAGAVRWETLPVPLRWVKLDVGEHMNAIVVGRIDEVWRDGNNVMGRGVFDVGSPEGLEAARQVEQMMTPGISVDLDDVSFEIRVKADLLEAADTPTELAEDGKVVVMEYASDDEVMVVSDARLRAATIVATPAFANARIHLLGYEEEMGSVTAGASVTPIRPPAAWFKDPKLDRPTGVTVTDEGRVFGHLATWGTCHTGFPGECVQAPSSATNYAYFRTGAIKTLEGLEVAVGRITMDTNHAGRRLGATDTAAHYDHTGLAVADVAAGEDHHGIWIAGALRPGVSDEQVRVLTASPLSGDWRRIGGNLELVAALAVNSPGFPIPRALVASGAVHSLQSSGVVKAAPIDPVGSNEDEEILARLLDRERKVMRQEQAAQARNRIAAAAAARRLRVAVKGRP